MTSIGNYSDEPYFTIKVVQTRTGIKPVTLRAWERRYDLLTPTRMPNGYRLYSERDIQLLTWVQRRLESGISISQVVQQFKQLRDKDEWPESVQTIVPEAPREKPPRPARDYAEIMFGAMVSHNEARAASTLSECQKYFDLVTLCEEVIKPSVELLGEAWYQGQIPIATKHLAEVYLKGELLSIMHNLPLVKEGPLVLVGCGPEDMHELDAVMLAVLLRQSGYFVEYLGPDLMVDDLIDYSTIAKPRLICLTVKEEHTAYMMREMASQLSAVRGKPKLAYSGKYLEENEQARDDLGGYYLGETLPRSLEKIKQILSAGF